MKKKLLSLVFLLGMQNITFTEEPTKEEKENIELAVETYFVTLGSTAIAFFGSMFIHEQMHQDLIEAGDYQLPSFTNLLSLSVITGLAVGSYYYSSKANKIKEKNK